MVSARASDQGSLRGTAEQGRNYGRLRAGTRGEFSAARARPQRRGRSGVARAQQNYPSRPVRFVLPFAAAGVADITARLAAEKLGDKLGQRFVVENMPGPGGIAAARAVLSQAADGYTIGLVTNGTAISVAIYKSLPFDPVKDFAPISPIGTFDLVFATNVGFRVQDAGGFHQGCASATGQAQCRYHRHRQHPESRCRAVQGAGRPQFPDRALSWTLLMSSWRCCATTSS